MKNSKEDVKMAYTYLFEVRIKSKEGIESVIRVKAANITAAENMVYATLMDGYEIVNIARVTGRRA
jgi:hypothetical protein